MGSSCSDGGQTVAQKYFKVLLRPSVLQVTHTWFICDIIFHISQYSDGLSVVSHLTFLNVITSITLMIV